MYNLWLVESDIDTPPGVETSIAPPLMLSTNAAGLCGDFWRSVIVTPVIAEFRHNIYFA